jgi:hypothetical protein
VRLPENYAPNLARRPKIKEIKNGPSLSQLPVLISFIYTSYRSRLP